MLPRLTLKAAAERKGCSKKTMHRAAETGKVNSDFDPVTGAYLVHDDEKLAQWQPGPTGTQPEVRA